MKGGGGSHLEKHIAIFVPDQVLYALTLILPSPLVSIYKWPHITQMVRAAFREGMGTGTDFSRLPVLFCGDGYRAACGARKGPQNHLI